MGRNELNDSMINGISQREISMINDASRLREQRAERIAKQLVDKFVAPNSYKFFLKCGYRMSENDIWSAVEAAHKSRVRSPIRYFISTCSRRPEMIAQ